ncbi:CDP-glycerol glycerophosphotransferase family protein [Bacteroides congonensis]|uniref:CDP-glycerol glycerophosphotransferase family protein n=1 Tax=Bacteroides congonensis TaxID=1871006 RepID=UPI00093377D1|nr:CDP-glycerol glycerophosphotransferase family protein [Bacteroides congonensis]
MNFIKHIFEIVLNLQEHYDLHKCRLYDVKRAPSKVILKKAAEIRKKNIIKVAFVVYDISKWKSEELYLQMLEHPRFEPVLVPVMCYHGDYVESTRQFDKCMETLKAKNYKYIVGSPHVDIDDLVRPDIVFYGELYDGLFDKQYAFLYNTKRTSLACYVPYCFRNTNIPETINHLENNLVWMGFVENNYTLEDFRPIMTNNAVNHYVTGLPIQDSFIKAFQNHQDVWKIQRTNKKCIIWAPSHTIKGENLRNAYEQSTFLDIADEMLQLVEKYKDSIQWAFKPHPVLKRKLIQVWGQERTDAYYAKWAELDNTQLEEGQYVDLFMGSDALIHDCMSFMVEYMYTEKPLLFLSNGHDNMNICNTQTKEAFKLHYKGATIEEVETFLLNIVMDEYDDLKTKRVEYKKKYLTPPNNRSSSQNIIDAILG